MPKSPATKRPSPQSHSLDTCSAAPKSCDRVDGVPLTNGRAVKKRRRDDRERTSEESSPDASPRNSIDSDESWQIETVREIDVNAAPGVHGGASKTRAFLSSYQLLDTLTILIVLLQIPPTLLTVVQVLFATLTFVSPSQAPNFHHISDFFQSVDGSPSLSVMILMDTIFALMAVFLWPVARGFLFDLSQAVIAISLGGGSAAGAIFKNSVVCCSLIAASQVTKRGLSLSSPVFLLNSTSPFLLVSADTESFRTSSGWIRGLLAVHILAQGVTKAVRRWFTRQADEVKDEKPKALTLNTTNLDPKMHHSPKKKKITTVRSQQPLWAALASTKVHVVKEMEQSQTIFEAGVDQSIEKGALSAAFLDEEARIWITDVGSADIGFNATLPNEPDDELSHAERKRAIYVRVNGAEWPSMRMLRESAADGREEWHCEIYGLAPLQTYECEFLRGYDNTIIDSVIVSTPPLDPEVPSPIQPPLRTASPLTTLLNSISAAEAKLADGKARLRQNKKDHKAQLVTLKKEVEAISGRLSSTGSGDDRQRQKILQSKQQIKQVEDATLAISVQIDELEAQTEDLKDWKCQKDRWKKEKERLNAAQAELTNHKLDAKVRVDAVLGESTAIQQKRERLLAKQARLGDHHKRITNANAQGLDEKDRKAAESLERERQRHLAEQNYNLMLNSLEQRIQDLRYRSTQTWKQVFIYETEVMKQQRAAQQMLSGELAPARPFVPFSFPNPALKPLANSSPEESEGSGSPIRALESPRELGSTLKEA